MTRMLATVVSVDADNHPVILLDGAGGAMTALRAGSYIPEAGDRCVVTRLGGRLVAEYAIDGEIGAGFSAYEIAVKHGFSGTEAEWLQSLVGPTGAAGAPGAAGLSAYQVAVAVGFTGTEAEWLASLKGAPGETFAPAAGRFTPYVCDFLTGTWEEYLPLARYLVNSGSMAAVSGDVSGSHIGVVELTGYTSGGGVRLSTHTGAMAVRGGEGCEIVFKRLTTGPIKMCVGYHKSESIADLDTTNGVMLRIDYSELSGRVNKGSTPVDTGSSYPLAYDTWYRAGLRINADATEAVFSLYAENGALLWQDSISGGVSPPVYVGMNMMASYSASIAFLAIDWLSFDIDRDLTR